MKDSLVKRVVHHKGLLYESLEIYYKALCRANLKQELLCLRQQIVLYIFTLLIILFDFTLILLRYCLINFSFVKNASKILNSVHSRHMKNVQKFAYFMVLDFEATCEKDIKIPDPEIIEFPVLMVNAYTLHTESIFHHYVRPTINPVLSDFCTELTGIIQSMIEDEPELPSILKMFDLFLDKNNLKICPYKFAFVTCGDWDLKIICYNTG
ncbi:ERI1 exoribonuclease 3 [Schistosoma japonicum]|nr:ERI1 exoribonuclease 3 [Schistosoma japonicum]